MQLNGTWAIHKRSRWKPGCAIPTSGTARRAGCRVNLIEEPENDGQELVQAAGNQESAGTVSGPRRDEIPEKSPGRLAAGLRSGRLYPADKVVFSYLAIVAVLIIANCTRVRLWWLLVLLHLLAMAMIGAVARLVDPTMTDETDDLGGEPPNSVSPGKTSSIVRSWYPLILIPLTYKELGYLIPVVHPHDFDREL